MPITTSPFTLRDTSLTLRLASGGTWQEYRCQLTAASLVPSQSGGGGGNEITTFCDTYSDGGASSGSTWELQVEGFQSYKAAEDFSLWAFDHEGEEAEFVLVPGQDGATISVTNPGFSGTVTVRPTTIGGTARQYATFSVSMPCTKKPTRITTAPAAAQPAVK